MTKDFYQENVKQYKTNMIYINTKDISIERQNEISRDILKFDGVASVTIIDTLMKTVSNMLNTMNYVVVILIVASALLAFKLLYALACFNDCLLILPLYFSLKYSKLSSATCVVGEAGANPILGFNASRCSSIYKDSATTVVPESLITNFYIRY